jgi:peptidoglycan/LPS O-acetylase OafA/YrhL
MGGVSQFMLGIMVAGYKHEIIAIGNKNKFIATFIFLYSIGVIMYFNHNYSIDFKMIIISHMIGVGLLTVHIIFESNLIKTNIITNLLMYAGVLSYGIYAWHGFLGINGINNYFYDNFSIHLLTSILMAYASYIMIEKPMLLFFKKY